MKKRSPEKGQRIMNETMQENEETTPQNASGPEITVSENTLKIRPTLTQIAIAKNLLSGATQKDACWAAGYSLKTATFHSTEIVNRPGVQTALAELLKAAGGTKDKVAETMVAGMKATKVSHSGEVVTDFTERRRSAETVSTFAGWKPAEKVEVGPGESYHDRIIRLNAERGGAFIDSYADEDEE